MSLDPKADQDQVIEDDIFSSKDPGDLSKFVKHGEGVCGSTNQEFSKSPIKSAPETEERGGVLYFSNSITQDDLNTMLRVIGVKDDPVIKQPKDYAIFAGSSFNPENDGYLNQIRIIPRFGLMFAFGALSDDEYENFPEQPLLIAELFWKFIESEKERWGTSFTQDVEKGLCGKFGGDGYNPREELSFGIVMENSYYGICRIWSRAWLVTK